MQVYKIYMKPCNPSTDSSSEFCDAVNAQNHNQGYKVCNDHQIKAPNGWTDECEKGATCYCMSWSENLMWSGCDPSTEGTDMDLTLLPL